MKKVLYPVFTMLLASALVAGCGSTTGSSSSSHGTSNASGSSGSGSSTSQVMIAGSASQGGANYLIMSGWAQLMKKYTGYQIRNESTGGPASNMQLMNTGKMSFGVISGVVGKEGYDGSGWSQGKKLDNVEALFGTNASYLDAIALQKSGIKSYDDLNGKKVSVGPAGGTSYVVAMKLFEVLGIHPKIVELGMNASVDALKNGQIDAMVVGGAFPRPAYVQLEATDPTTHLELTPAELQKAVSAFPAFQIGVIPKGTYKYLTHDEKTIEDQYFYAVSSNVPENVAYQVTKATLDHLQEFQQVHKSLKSLTLQQMVQVPIPLAPGAAKAFQEAGIQIPSAAQPK